MKTPFPFVIPAKAGIQGPQALVMEALDPRFRGDNGKDAGHSGERPNP